MKVVATLSIVLAAVAGMTLTGLMGSARSETVVNSTVSCPAGRWLGSRVHLEDDGGEVVVEDNFIELQRMLIRVGEMRPGAKVDVIYGDDFQTAVIQYAHWPYVVLNYQPKQIVENLAVNVRDGRVLYTTYKQFLGSFSTDSFAMRCRAITG